LRFLFLFVAVMWGFNFFRFILDDSYVPDDFNIGLSFAITTIYFLMAYFREKNDPTWKL